jgi:hypothetical protein
MQGSNEESITIYNIYNVCKSIIGRAGAATAFVQQWHLLRMAGDKDPNPRKQCITDFNFTLQEHQKNPELWDIIHPLVAHTKLDPESNWDP